MASGLNDLFPRRSPADGFLQPATIGGENIAWRVIVPIRHGQASPNDPQFVPGFRRIDRRDTF